MGRCEVSILMPNVPITKTRLDSQGDVLTEGCIIKLILHKNLFTTCVPIQSVLGNYPKQFQSVFPSVVLKCISLRYSVYVAVLDKSLH